MNKLSLSLLVLFCTSAVSFGQNDMFPPIESDEWYNSGAWKTDHDLQLLYFNIQESVKNTIPVDPAVLEATKVLQEKREAALIEKADELGVKVDEHGNLTGENGNFDKGIWYDAIKNIQNDFDIERGNLWSSWNEEFQKRFEEAFVEAARNLKLNAQKMK